VDGYIAFTEATATQAEELTRLVPRLETQLAALGAAGAFSAPGPVLLGIGASLSAAAPAVWRLRAGGVPAWRLGAGDTPLPLVTGDHPVVAISQSGRSSETVAALESVAPELRYAVVNTAPSPLSELASRRLELGNIADSYASTIGYTATVTALAMLAEAWADGRADASWASLGERFRQAETSLAPGLDAAAELFAAAPSADFVGGGASLGSAEAGALLFREAARIPASAMSTRQYLHGSMESAGEGVHVLFGEAREAQLARTLADAGHRVLLVTSDPGLEVRDAAVVALPESSEAQRPVFEALALQGLVRRVAELRGVDIEEFVFHNDDTKLDVSDVPA